MSIWQETKKTEMEYSKEGFDTSIPPPAYASPSQRRRVRPAVAPTIGPDGQPLHFGEEPIPFTCPFCGVYVMTAVHYKPGGHSFCVCCIISAFVIPNLCFLCYIPMCVAKCCDIEHACPNCARTINITKRTWKGKTK